MRTVTLIFDGGVRGGNPGYGYGSWQIEGLEKPVLQRVHLGPGMTNNESEFLTCLCALWDVRDRLGNAQMARTKLRVRGDSQVVIKGLNREHELHGRDLAWLCARSRQALRGFADLDVAWHPRERSVAVLGH